MEKRYKWIIGLLSPVIIAFSLFLLPADTAAAADFPVYVTSVDYYLEEIEVYNYGNSKLYYATEINAAKGSWDEMDVDGPNTSRIDFSWVSDTMENILVIKGDNSANEVRVKLVKKPTKLSITINYTDMKKLDKSDNIASLVNIMSDVGTGANPINFSDIEWKKGISGQWSDTNSLTVQLMEKFLINGTNLYFRIKALPDEAITSPGGTIYPDGTKGRRFSSEIKVKVPKQNPPATYEVDVSKLAVEIKYGKEYRISLNGGTSFSDWVQVTDKAVKSLNIADMLKATNNNPSGILTGLFKDNEFPAMIMEIRDYATAKEPASKISRIKIKEQFVLEQSRVVNDAIGTDPLNNNNNIYISYNGDKNLVIQIPSAGPSNSYEYCVVKPGDSLDLKKTSWTAISKATEVKVANTKAVQGGTLYIRVKGIKSIQNKLSADGVTIASTCVTHAINYPSIPVIAKASFTFVKKYSEDIVFDINLGSIPYETSVKEIKLGTRNIDFTSASLSATELRITLKKESLNAMPNSSNKYISIYFDKGTVDKNSIRITIQNPTPAGTLSVSSAKGADIGSTSITMVFPRGVNNNWSYVVGNTQIDEVYTQNKIADVTALAATGFSDATMKINVNVGDYLTIFETNAEGYIIKYKCIKITAAMVKTE